MAQDRLRRHLAAILVADMVGYSRLVEADEAETLARQKEYLAGLIEPAIAEYGGRIFKTTGDGLFAEFASAVDAVECAISIQDALNARETGHGEDRLIRYRIGINLGDIVVDGDDMLGDGVNVAARIESACEPGAVCVSGLVYENVKGKLDAEFEDLGAQNLKNISRSVQIYGVRKADGRSAERRSTTLPGHAEGTPSIAVLPFDCMSSDPDQQFVADGIVEDVITELSRFHWLLVIARNSSFAYRNSTKDVREIARELGVRYIVEGSLRSAGGQLRLTAQLIEATSGAHIWADRFDKRSTDVFALQDELTSSVVGRIAPSLRNEEIRRAVSSEAPDIGAWQHHVRALSYYYRFSKDDNDRAIAEFCSALRTDPGFQISRAFLSKALFTKVWLGWSVAPAEDLVEADRQARAAVAAEPGLAEGHYALACAEFWIGHLDAAFRGIERSLDLNPNFAEGYLVKSQVLCCLGRFDEAEPGARHALVLNPADPLRWVYLGNLADALYGQERWAEALTAASGACDLDPTYAWGHLLCAAASSRLGNDADARQHVEAIQALEGRNAGDMIAEYPFAHDADRNRISHAIERL